MTSKNYIPLLIKSEKAAADLEQHRFAGFDGNYCNEGAKALGVIDSPTEKGQYAPVAVWGVLLVEAAETIAVGNAITSDSNGKAIVAADDSEINGYALDSAEPGEEIRIVRGI